MKKHLSIILLCFAIFLMACAVVGGITSYSKTGEVQLPFLIVMFVAGLGLLYASQKVKPAKCPVCGKVNLDDFECIEEEHLGKEKITMWNDEHSRQIDKQIDLYKRTYKCPNCGHIHIVEP